VIPLGLADGESLDLDLLRRDRDRIWKAGHLAYEAGRLPMLSPEQEAESERRNHGFMVENIFIEPLRKWIDGRGWRNKGPHHEFTTDEAILGAEICTEVGKINTTIQRKVADALRDLGFVLDKHQRTVKGRKQPRRWRQDATSDDLGSEEPSEADQTPAQATGPGDQPRTSTTQEIDLRVGEDLDTAPVMGAASERGLNTSQPFAGIGVSATSDKKLSEAVSPDSMPLWRSIDERQPGNYRNATAISIINDGIMHAMESKSPMTIDLPLGISVVPFSLESFLR